MTEISEEEWKKEELKRRLRDELKYCLDYQFGLLNPELNTPLEVRDDPENYDWIYEERP